MKHKIYAKYVKRFMDIFISLIGIVFLWWLFIVVWVIVRIKLGSPAIFVQKRPGYKEKIFALYKFRTMTDQRDSEGNLLPDEQRMTSLGCFLRKTSLDELPQLWNILKGDMSIIGPRPLLVSYLDRYTEDQHHRHDVRPGLFGLAGVNGRNAQNWDSKFIYDLYYVDNVSFWLDTKIFVKCIFVVLGQKGVNEENTATASEYKGKSEQ